MNLRNIHNNSKNTGSCSIASAAIRNANTTIFPCSMKRKLPIIASNNMTSKLLLTRNNTFQQFRKLTSIIGEQHHSLLLHTGTRGWSIFSPLPYAFQQQQPQSQQQQIRTYAKRSKRRKMEKVNQHRVLQRRRGYPVSYRHHGEKKHAPVSCRDHIGRLMNKATRGERKLEFLIDFVEQYIKYNLDVRRNVIIPYIRENFRSVAYQHFFLRIIQSITLDNNNTGMNGFDFVIQFRTDLMKVIYDKVKELKTLDRKIKLMRLRLLEYDKLKRTIRKEMSLYILDEISSKSFRITIPDTRKSSFPFKVVPSKTSSRTTSKDKKNSQSNNTTKSAILSPESCNTDPTTPKVDTESKATAELSQSPIMLGFVRRVCYDDLTARFVVKCERRDPTLQSKLLKPNKIAYGWYQTDKSIEPDMLIFISLQDRIPTSLSEILDKEETNAESPKKLHVATVYGILVLKPALEKIGLGECMIRPIIQHLLDDPQIPLSINQFSTLLPLYSFRNWLLNNEFEDDISLLVINDSSEDFNVLMREWECPKEQVFRRLKALLSRNYQSFQATILDKPIVSTAVDNLLLLSASSYLIRAKTPVVKWRCNPLEISTRYHVAQGASIHRVNVAADTSESGWIESCGLMTNHIYDILSLASNQAKYNKKFNSIEIHDHVRKYIPKPRKLELNKEQREKWIPIDPVRKKMIELSQNGKLFRVPLVGPPALSRKRYFHKRLVPERVRPGLVAPVVPTVGVSGLTVYVKPATIASRTAAIPSYVARTVKGLNTTALPKTSNNRSRESSKSFWPDEVDFSLRGTNSANKDSIKSSSQRGTKKKEKGS